MNTSELDRLAGGAVSGLDLAGSRNAALAGFPDPAVIARMAREFMADAPLAPNALTAAAAPVSAPSAEALVLNPPLPGVPDVGSLALPHATEFAIPAQSDFALPGETQAVTRQASSFSVPVLPAAPIELAGAAPYSFLSEARSLFASPPAGPAHAVPLPATPGFPSSGIPYGGSLANPGFKLPTPSNAAPEIAAPQIDGTVARSVPGPSAGFLDLLRPLDPVISVARAEPYLAESPLPSTSSLSSAPFDVNAIRRDFPALHENVGNGRRLIWFDNAATTQKPRSVIDRLSHFYEHENSNVHRAAHDMAARASDAYDASREKVRRFLNASDTSEIVFVRGATEGINLVAQSWGRRNVGKDDEIVVTWLEHHANIVPWQMLCAEKGARLRVAPVDDEGQVILEEYEKLLGPKTRLVSIAHVSNALGTVTPVREMTEMAHRQGARVLVDGAQAVSHMGVDVQAIDCDFYVFSGHKVFAPTGIGVVFGKSEVLNVTPPWQGGGNMIADVTFEKTIYQPPPGRFEAGTGSIADAVGLGAAIDYLDRLGMANVARYEHDLLVYGIESLKSIPGLRLIGTAKEKASVLSFVLEGLRTEDIGAALNREGIAVRSGHHCAQPILRRYGLESTVRPSLAFYNTCEEIDALVAAIWNLKSGRNSGLR